MVADHKADAPRGVTRCVDGAQRVFAKGEGVAVRNPPVGWQRHHAGVPFVEGKAGVSLVTHLANRLYVIAMPVRGENVTHPQPLELFEDPRRLVGRVDEQRLFRLRVADNVDVVVVRSHREADHPIHGPSLLARHSYNRRVTTTRRIGMHMHTGRGLDKLADTIKALGVNTIQIFTGNPSAWRSAPVDPNATDRFKQALEDLEVRPALAHAMYLINLAGPNPSFYAKSKVALKGELQRAEAYGCQYVVTHVGSHMGRGTTAGSGPWGPRLMEVRAAGP